MTSTLTETVIAIITANTYQALSNTFGVMAILLLIVLLVIKELFRVSERHRLGTRLQAFDVALVPLLLAFGLVMLMRFFNL